ncbi:MAG: DUF6266 family protein [Flavobacteriaceae bacterium]|jgi:hypothetical protein|nr:DUF6266 family protein [Flavobacteriaceae bacterium]
MAEITKGILGGFSGKVGTVVGANFRGKDIMRSVPKKSKKKPTEKQLAQRERFTIAAKFLQPLKQYTREYYGPGQGAKSSTNLAMAYHLTDAVVMQNGKMALDYSKVLITKGVLSPVANATATATNLEVTVSWVDNSGEGQAKKTDAVTVFCYSKSLNKFFFYGDKATRQDTKLTFKLPNSWKDKDNVIWMAVANAQANINSTSMYLGVM